MVQSLLLLVPLPPNYLVVRLLLPVLLLTKGSSPIWLVQVNIGDGTVAILVIGNIYGAGSFLRDPANFSGIRGRLFFNNAIDAALAPKQASEIGFLEHYLRFRSRPLHAFLYSTADAQGKAVEYDGIVDTLREYFTTETDEANGNRPFSLEEITYQLQEGEEYILQNMSNSIHIA